MLALEFFRWWYGSGWALLVTNSQKRIIKVASTFSIPILLRTIFAPWRKIVTYPSPGIGNHLRATLDNLVSRVVGFIVRLFVLLTAAVMIVVVVVFAALVIVAWPFVPLLVPASIIKGIVA